MLITGNIGGVNMTIIADSGATNTVWCGITSNGEQQRMTTDGINVTVMPHDVIRSIVDQAASYFKAVTDEAVSDVHFYAAGLLAMPEDVDEEFHHCWPDAEVEYASDLLAAARAVCGHNPGIAAILGTGSNSCFYDGEHIVRNIHSCGYILGDQGSAAALGKAFMSDFLQERVPQAIADEFAAAFDVSYPTVVAKVYRGEAPSRYLGSFAPWITERCEKDGYMHDLVEGNFRSFIVDCLKRYDTYTYAVGVVGSFAAAFEDMIRGIGNDERVRFSVFCKSPMEGLLAYHTAR